jgi:hypothetical protein
MAKLMLTVAGILNLVIAALHIGIIIWGPKAYAYFGAGQEMARMDSEGSLVPSVVTALVAIVFILFGLYAFSGAQITKILPFTRYLLPSIGIIFLLRSLLIFVSLYQSVSHSRHVPPEELVFSSAALIIGLFYLLGWLGTKKTIHPVLSSHKRN